MKNPLRYFFEKRTPATAGASASHRGLLNPLRGLDPDILVQRMSEFASGYIGPLMRTIDEFERRDDKMTIGAYKMRASVARCPWDVRVVPGAEGSPDADAHRDALREFWTRVTATDALCRNRRGGVRLLLNQMMQAQSRMYAVHDIVWKPLPGGKITANFISVPAWNFENSNGVLRFLPNGELDFANGQEMLPGEWLVTVGEGIGIAACVLAMAKRLSWNDWLLFSEKCGMPFVSAATSAAQGSSAWNALEDAIGCIAPKTGLVTDPDSRINVTPMAASQPPFREIVEAADRAISALYRGADLSTCSSADATGASVQEGESDLMEQDSCAMISETLHDQVDRFVIRYLFGADPLASIAIEPEKRQNVDQDIKIDAHLVSMGARLSRADALARYGRTEADPQDPGDAPLRAPQPQSPLALANETPLQSRDNPLHFAPRPSDGSSQGPTPTPALNRLLEAFSADLGPAAEKIKSLLSGGLTPDKASALAAELPNLLPSDPALAAILAEETAKALEEHPAAWASAANTSQTWHKCPNCGRFDGFDGHCEKCGYVLGANEAKKRTEELLGDAARDAYAKPVNGISYREELGRIDLPVGRIGEWDEKNKQREHGSGLSKIREKHGEDLEHLPDTITYGEVLRTRYGDDDQKPEAKNRRAIIYKGYVCFVEKDDNGSWTITTHYKTKADFAEKLKRIAEAL